MNFETKIRLRRFFFKIRVPYSLFLNRPEWVLIPSTFICSLFYALFISGSFIIRSEPNFFIFTSYFEGVFLYFSQSDRLFVFFSVSFLPYLYFWYRKIRLVDSAEDGLPEILLDISRKLNSGLTLAKAFDSFNFSEENIFTAHISAIGPKMLTGMTFKEASSSLVGFDSDLINRTFSIIQICEKAGGALSLSFRIAAQDARYRIYLKKKRRSERLSYVVLLILSYAIFLYIFLMLAGPFKTLFFSEANNDLYFVFFNGLKDAFYIQALFCGLICGKIVFGRMRAGISFVFLFATVAFFSFYAVGRYF